MTLLALLKYLIPVPIISCTMRECINKTQLAKTCLVVKEKTLI